MIVTKTKCHNSKPHNRKNKQTRTFKLRFSGEEQALRSCAFWMLTHVEGSSSDIWEGTWMQQVFRVSYPQSAARRRSGVSVAPSSTPNNTNPQQPDTGDEQSRQACKRGVPSRPGCLSAERSFKPSMPNAADCLGEDHSTHSFNPTVCLHGSNKSRLL